MSTKFLSPYGVNVQILRNFLLLTEYFFIQTFYLESFFNSLYLNGYSIKYIFLANREIVKKLDTICNKIRQSVIHMKKLLNR